MSSSSLLLWGQANPEAFENSYNGVYLNKQDMQDMVSQVNESKRKGEKIPVHIEHTGSSIGNVVSAWVENNTLQCILEIDNKTLESSMGQQMVKDGLIKELSLGYLLDIKHTKNKFESQKKFLQEISIVKKGAREKCKILGVANNPIKKK